MSIRSIGARRALVLAAVAPLAAGCIQSPESQARAAQQLNDLDDAVNELRVTEAAMQTTLDSLRVVIAKQDTTIARLANVTGVVVVK